MTEAPVTLLRPRTGDARAIFDVSAAHFVSHFYMLVLPPLFAFIRKDYGVSYTELGLALTAFNFVSAALQTPAGFLVDHIGARKILIVGLLLGAAGFAVAAAVDSFWVLVVAFAFIGLGNTSYHPADYALLSEHVSADRMGRAFSIHTFCGVLGSAVAPATLLYLQDIISWRGAFYVAAALGLVVACFVALPRDETDMRRHTPPQMRSQNAQHAQWRFLLSGPILQNLFFFTFLAFITGGIQNYSVVALAALHGTPLAVGNVALTGNLLVAAAGILLGGRLIGRVSSSLVAMLGILVTGLAILLVGVVALGPILLFLIMCIAGFANGITMPSRDMIVREVTPPGSFGRVFGFVSTGFNIGGIVSPLIFGALMDHGNPRAVFLLVAASCLLSIVTLVAGHRLRPAT